MERFRKGVVHRERAQPGHRRGRFPFLERHKDYVVRAKDYNKKRSRLKELKEKAEFRNPDEFYFAMVGKQLTGGGKHSLSQEGRQISENALDFVRIQKQIEEKAAKKQEESLSFMPSGKRLNKQTIFVDNEEDVRKFDPSEHFETPEDLVDSVFRPKVGKNKELEIQANFPIHLRKGSRMGKKAAKSSAAAYAELAARLDRTKTLEGISDELQLRRNLKGKGKRKQIVEKADNHRAVYQWRLERKR